MLKNLQETKPEKFLEMCNLLRRTITWLPGRYFDPFYYGGAIHFELRAMILMMIIPKESESQTSLRHNNDTKMEIQLL